MSLKPKFLLVVEDWVFSIQVSKGESTLLKSNRTAGYFSAMYDNNLLTLPITALPRPKVWLEKCCTRSLSLNRLLKRAFLSIMWWLLNQWIFLGKLIFASSWIGRQTRFHLIFQLMLITLFNFISPVNTMALSSLLLRPAVWTSRMLLTKPLN